MKLFIVTYYGAIDFYSSDFLTAHRAKGLRGTAAKLEEAKMNSKLYNRAYKFLKLRAKTKDCFAPLQNLEPKESIIVKEFLKQQHQVKFI